MRSIFLDDERVPAIDEDWTWVQGVDEMMELIALTGADTIERISFDHDLGFNLPTGFEAVKRIVALEMDNPGSLSGLTEIIFHSANPIGIANMEGYLLSAQKNGILEDVKLIRRSVLDHPHTGEIRHAR